MKHRQTRKPKRHLNKKLIPPLIVLAVGILAFAILKFTENGVFTVMDYSQDVPEVATYKHFIFAKMKLESLDPGSVSCIQDDSGKVVALQNGIVNFTTKDISENTAYTTDNGEEGYLNGHYGSDALYVDTSPDGSKVEFLMAGVKGWVDVSDITLYFYDPAYALSSYERYNDSLVHQVCTDLKNNEAISYSICQAPDFMEENTTYYSYDGHYFYTDFMTMSQDVRNNTHESAISSDPFYNFYQFVPHRSATRLPENTYNEFLYNTKGIDSAATAYPCLDNESVLYDSASLFYQAQSDVFVNASMMFALACNESGYGQSQYAIEQHNIFGHEAYDEDPDSATMYTDLQECIRQHAYYFIQQSYANPDDWRYHGSWFGDKNSGINVMYASDPYWGEKAGALYYRLDQGTDQSDIRLLTFECGRRIDVCLEDGTVLYSYDKGDTASFVVQEESDDGYKVRLEVPVAKNKIDPAGTYDPKLYGYIDKK